tara:strand:+ start:2624 stop:2851 length:228 start_codon:yes stop_codon:yes gene_type:complete
LNPKVPRDTLIQARFIPNMLKNKRILLIMSGGNENSVHLITDRGAEAWSRLTKQQLANGIAERIALHFSAAQAAE